MKNPPAFQFYPSDFLSDENVVLMNNTEVGCYIKLLCFCWKQGSIPNDVNKIAKLCNETGESMAELWLAISSCFKSSEKDGRLIHPRLDKERKKQLKFSQERSVSGKKGAEIRWKNKPNSSAIAQPIAKPMAKNSSSSSSSINKYSVDFLEFYSAYPLKKSKAKAYKAWKKLKPDLHTCLAALQSQMIEKGFLKAEKKFCPEWKHPSTWLNDKCWEDECVVKTKKILTGDEALYYEG